MVSDILDLKNRFKNITIGRRVDSVHRTNRCLLCMRLEDASGGRTARFFCRMLTGT